MKNTLELIFHGLSGDTEEGQIMVALLLDAGAEGIQESPDSISVYVEQDNFDAVMSFLKESGGYPDPEIVCHEWQNWNLAWEKYYPMVIVDNAVVVYAPFHKELPEAKFKIMINPGMAFGTGHHSTTTLMLKLMLEQTFAGKIVIDMGSGTGVLAILASMLGAKDVLAVDNDQNAFESATKSVEMNGLTNIRSILGDASSIAGLKADIILANITRNILLRDFDAYVNSLNPGGLIFLSGFISEDSQQILTKAQDSGFQKMSVMTDREWMAVCLRKL